VAEVAQVAQAEVEVPFGAHRGEGPVTTVDRDPLGLGRLDRPVGEQQAGLLEGLPDRRHPVGQAPAVEAQAL